MKIKTRLIVGFGMLLVLLVGITSFGYDRLSRMNDRLVRFYDDQFIKVRDAIDLRSGIDSAGNSVNNVLLNMLDSDVYAVEELNRQTETYSAELEAFRGKSFSPEERQLVDAVSHESGRYVDFLKRFALLVDQGQYEEALSLQKSQGRLLQENVVKSLDSLVTFEQMTMEEEQARTEELYNDSIRLVGGLTVAGILAGFGVMLWIFPQITRGLNLLGLMARKFGQGRLRGFSRIEIKRNDELGELAKLFKRIAMDLQIQKDRERLYAEAKEQQAWLDGQLARTTELLKDFSDARSVAQSFIHEFAPVLGASYGAVYLREEAGGGLYSLAGAYALNDPDAEPVAKDFAFRTGEGLLGQAVMSGKPIAVEPVPSGYVRIRSGLGEAEPVQLLLQPILFNRQPIGVIELAYLRPAAMSERDLLEKLCEKFAYIVANIRSRQRVEELLRESQALAEELQAQSEELISQQEELRQTNEKLEGHTTRLKRSEERLQRQQEELEHTNQELTVKTLALEEQNRQTESKSREVAKANAELERQALQLALASQYKSEFLANMSHELRTPLNSMIILAQFLEENNEGNLTDKQLNFIQTIHSSSNDLLKMIDEILDLAKVDAGKMDVQPEPTLLEDITTNLRHTYESIAAKKGLEFAVLTDDDVPSVLYTDGHRLKQILRNLLSNALKFTPSGFIRLHIRRCEPAEAGEAVRSGGPFVAFAVEDSGVGIPEDKRELVFEAFRQADGTTSRKFGGTGLGLTISKELAVLLGGSIRLESEPGRGSVFTLILPERCPERQETAISDSLLDSNIAFVAAAAEPGAGKPEAPSEPEAGRERSGSESEPETLPAGRDSGPQPDEPQEERADAARKHAGDSAFVGKTVLLVDDDERNLYSLTSLLEHHRLNVLSAENGRAALELLETGPSVDIVLMDVMMPEMDGYEAMASIRRHPKWSGLPVIALTAKAMKDDRNKCLEAGASDYLAKPVQIQQLLSLLKVWLSR
ncbi:response regulator [Cohnella massiliensis]|uniref:response regulator n=1 Tax=Cohnella massiliensis TaxID=1816691 RepID=UPI0009B99C5C|nr:response regulator [Cohnella massiliensis]